MTSTVERISRTPVVIVITRCTVNFLSSSGALSLHFSLLSKHTLHKTCISLKTKIFKITLAYTFVDGPISTEHCDWLYGIFGHETSCTRYWTCWNGTATEQLCIGGLLYNENAHSCDWPENVDGCQKHRMLF